MSQPSGGGQLPPCLAPARLGHLKSKATAPPAAPPVPRAGCAPAGATQRIAILPLGSSLGGTQRASGSAQRIATLPLVPFRTN